MNALRKMSFMPAEILERSTPAARQKGRLQEEGALSRTQLTEAVQGFSPDLLSARRSARSLVLRNHLCRHPIGRGPQTICGNIDRSNLIPEQIMHEHPHAAFSFRHAVAPH